MKRVRKKNLRNRFCGRLYLDFDCLFCDCFVPIKRSFIWTNYEVSDTWVPVPPFSWRDQCYTSNWTSNIPLIAQIAMQTQQIARLNEVHISSKTTVNYTNNLFPFIPPIAGKSKTQIFPHEKESRTDERKAEIKTNPSFSSFILSLNKNWMDPFHIASLYRDLGYISKWLFFSWLSLSQGMNLLRDLLFSHLNATTMLLNEKCAQFLYIIKWYV